MMFIRTQMILRWSLAVMVTLVTFLPTWAQDTPPDMPQDSPQQDQPLNIPVPEKVDYAAQFPMPSGIPTEEPYIRWTKHAGKLEEGIAHVIARYPNGSVRSTTGISIRCDGMILVPVWVREAVKEGAAVTVAPAEAENETLTAPLPLAGRFYHNIPRVEYTIIKVNGHHLPCVPLLESKNIAPGIPVRIYQAITDTPGRCKATWVAARVEALAENPEAGRQDRWTLKPAEDKGVLTAETAPAGSLVVDDQSGAVLGIVLEAQGARAIFTSFIYFYDIAGEVGLMPDRVSIKERERQPQNITLAELNALRPGKPTNEWKWIPGGPLRLSGAILDLYRRNFRTDTVCMPGFFIGAYPVTHKQYFKMGRPPGYKNENWKAGAADYLETLPNNPQGLERQDTALQYVFQQGARLPTECEWVRASLCRDYGWVYRRLELWDNTLRDMISMFNASVHSADNPDFAQTINPPQEDLRVRDQHNQMNTEIPWHSCDVTLRAGEDLSIFGVTNVLMNSDEYLLPTLSTNNHTQKPFGARMDPLLSRVFFNAGWGAVVYKDNKAVQTRSIGTIGASSLTYVEYLRMDPNTFPLSNILYNLGLLVMRVPRPGEEKLLYQNMVDLPSGQGVVVYGLRISIRWQPRIYPGFRLVR